jgi:hypothetical protein
MKKSIENFKSLMLSENSNVQGGRCSWSSASATITPSGKGGGKDDNAGFDNCQIIRPMDGENPVDYVAFEDFIGKLDFYSTCMDREDFNFAIEFNSSELGL